MAGYSSEMGFFSAGEESRELQRDAHVRLGACVFFAVALGLALFASHWLPWVLIPAIAAALGVSSGYLAFRRGRRITEKLQEENRAERIAAKEKQIEDMLKARQENG